MKLFVEDIAVEIAKTLISTDQRELIDRAAERNITTAKGVAVASFELAEALLEEYTERYGE
jgi:hypothetical protein